MRIATVTPVYRNDVTPAERTSLTALHRILGRYDRVLVAPPGIDAPAGFTFTATLRFDASYFTSVRAYSRLLLDDAFYAALSDFDFILIYQLDAYVFRDDLEEWARRGYDYVGAPFFEDTATGDRFQLVRLERERQASPGGLPIDRLASRVRPFAVGNGGLSLRRIAAAREVLQSRCRPPFISVPYSRDAAAAVPFSGARGFLKQVLGRTRVGLFTRDFVHEDLFWSFAASAYVKSFRIPSPEEAMGFAFETEPELCYHLSGRRLPFGCHAWERYQPSFWRAHMSPDGRHEE